MMLLSKQDYVLNIDFDYLIAFMCEAKLYRNHKKYTTKKDFATALTR